MELNLKQTVARIKDLNDEIERLGEKEELSAEQQTQFDEMVEEFRALNTHHDTLVREERLEEVRRVMKAKPGYVYKGDSFDSDPIGEPGSAEVRDENPWDIDSMRAYPFNPGAQAEEFRSRALSAIEKMPGASDAVREASTKLIEDWDTESARLSRLVVAASSPAYLRAFRQYLKHGTNAANFMSEDERQAVTRAMSLTDTEGGFLVPFQLDPSVIITSDGSLNEIRQIARRVVATGDVWNGVSAGATSWSWDTEAEEVSDDASTFAQPSITIHKAQGFVPISIEALADEQNVTAEVGRLMAFGKDELEAAAFATGLGDGSNQPVGIVTALDGTAADISSATTDTFAVEDLYATKAVPARYRANGSWLANDGIYDLVRQFDTSGGADLWTQLSFDRPPQLLGKPAYEAEAMDGVITALAENNVLVFGDFSHYVIADRIGMTVELVPHLFATGANRPSGQRGIFAYYRVGADSVNDGAFHLLNVT